VLALTAVNLLRRWGRSALAALGIALGVTTVVALLALTQGLEQSAGDLAHLGRADLGVFQGGLADLTARSGASRHFPASPTRRPYRSFRAPSPPNRRCSPSARNPRASSAAGW